MAISYKPLWHQLIEKDFKKGDLKKMADITSNVVARMGKDSYVNLDSLEKICLALDCQLNEVVEILPDEEESKGGII